MRAMPKTGWHGHESDALRQIGSAGAPKTVTR
jgi:hypothetical protein